MFIRPSGNKRLNVTSSEWKSHNRSPSVVLVHKFNVKEDLMSIGNRAGILLIICECDFGVLTGVIYM